MRTRRMPKMTRMVTRKLQKIMESPSTHHLLMKIWMRMRMRRGM